MLLYFIYFAAGSGLDEKTITQRAWLLYFYPNNLWVRVQVMILGTGLDSVKPTSTLPVAIPSLYLL